MVVHMEAGRVHHCGSPAEVLSDLEVREESSAPEKEVDHEICEENSSDHSKQQLSVVRYACGTS